MIFVTVGTTAFNTLVKVVDESEIDDEVIIQKSDGIYIPKNHKSFEYTEKLDEYLQKADIVITHGGAGTLFKLLAMGKKVIGVANEERKDLHQQDLLKKLSDEGYLIWCKDIRNLSDCLKKTKKVNTGRYQPPICKISDSIKKFIDL